MIKVASRFTTAVEGHYQDPRARFFIPTVFFTQHPPNFLIDLLENPGLQPFLIMITHRGWRRKIMR